MSVQMWLREELPFICCKVEHQAKTVELEALVDTGSAGTMFSSEVASPPELGGTEGGRN